MKLRLARRWAIKLLIIGGLVCYATSTAWSAQGINPKEAIGNPMIVRLQQGREKLNQVEEEEIKKYGFTGLEIITYLDYNEDPGRDNDSIQTLHVADASGSILSYGWLLRQKYYYKELANLYIYKTIKPGDTWRKQVGIFFNPQQWYGNGYLRKNFLRSKDQSQEEETWQYFNDIRRVKRMPSYDFEDNWAGSCFSRDDREYRKAWEEEHRILGEDNIRGEVCLVIESKHLFKPKYYLSKRITWVTKDNFLDLHEEQFDKEGRLFRVVDNEWLLNKPENYWARTQKYCTELNSKVKAIYQLYGWKFDQGFSDNIFSSMEMRKEHFWRSIDPPPIPIKDISDFPPEPSIRWEFWNKIGIKPEVRK